MELKPTTFPVKCISDMLLIVPYGIETVHNCQVPASSGTFNRTLWN